MKENNARQASGCNQVILSCLGISSDATNHTNTDDNDDHVNTNTSTSPNDTSTTPPGTLLEEQKREEWEDARKLHESILSQSSTFILGYGEIADFHKGLGTFLGQPKKLVFEAMEKEHTEGPDCHTEFDAMNHDIKTTSAIEWFFVVDPNKGLEKLGLRDWPSPPDSSTIPQVHRRKVKTLNYLEESLVQINRKLNGVGIPSLTMNEVIACRLYSGPLGTKYNKMIRANIAGHRKGQEWRLEEEQRLCKGNKYPTTMHAVQSAIAKLGKINPHSTAFSGVADGLTPPWFWESHDELGTKGGVECSFMSMSKDESVAKYYAGLKGDKPIGTIFEVEMGTMDRGAELTWLSQYPHEDEIILPPLTYLHVQHIKRSSPDPSTNKQIITIYVRSRLSSILVETPLLSTKESAQIKMAIKRTAESSEFESNTKLISKFSDETNHLMTGSPMEAVLGLSHFLGVDDGVIQRTKATSKGAIEAMVNEIEASGEQEMIRNMKYIFHEKASELRLSNGIRDQNNSGKTLCDFANHEMAQKYKLSESHVAALRLYTTSAFQYLNKPLRDSIKYENHHQDEAKEGERIKPVHPFPITVSLIDEGIKRLRALTAEAFEEKTDIFLWRGIRNTNIGEEFLEGRRGGTELGLMSTTRDVKIAAEYSTCAEGNALLFKFKIENMKQFGADISWLSAFPSEAEILYPPLTFLQPTGKVETTSINDMLLTIVEIQPHL